ncbi:MAG: DUF2336 domain-containing protein [Kiloniellaceae bacterium]
MAARLESPDFSASDRRAAEELARQLANDAVEMVRLELSKAVRNSRFLPRDIAMKIAHDVESVACPFLEATEVFSEEDWQQLILTVSKGARVAIARRPRLSENLANSLAEIGDSCVAEALLENERAPIQRRTYTILMERFHDSPWILGLMADRKSLPADLAVALVSKASEAARRTLAQTYGIEDFTDPLAAEARGNALLRVIRNADQNELFDYARALNRTGELGPALLMQALRIGLLEFFEAAMAVRTGIPQQNIRALVRSGSEDGMTRLCEKAGLPLALGADFCSAVKRALFGPEPNTGALA